MGSGTDKIRDGSAVFFLCGLFIVLMPTIWETQLPLGELGFTMMVVGAAGVVLTMSIERW